MCCIVVRQGCLSQHGQSSRHWPNLAVEPEMHDEHTKLTLLSYLYSQLKRSAMIQHTHTHSPRISPIYLSPGSFWARDYNKPAAAVPCAQTSMLYTSLVIFFFFPELPFFWHEATSSVCQCLSVCLSVVVSMRPSLVLLLLRALQLYSYLAARSLLQLLACSLAPKSLCRSRYIVIQSMRREKQEEKKKKKKKNMAGASAGKNPPAIIISDR